jgi:DNA-binding PadR family transcriptional regulator
MVTYVWIDVLLLATLNRQPMHGYELRKQVEESTGKALSNNSLYPALRRFAEAGAVTRSAEEQEGRPARQVYAITGVGQDLLRDMLADLPPELAADTPEFMARLANFHLLSPTERLRVLDARDAALTEQQDRLTALAAAQEQVWPRLALDEACRRITNERAWLDTIRVPAARTEPEGITR